MKTKVVKEHWTRVQDGSKHSTGVTAHPGKLGQIASDMETDTVLKRDHITDTISQTEAVKEEANTEPIDKIKRSSNKICIRNDLAKKNMMFSPESCQAIVDMGNVELIELKKFRVQCPSCLHYAFDGTIVCSSGKQIRSNQETIDRIRKAFDILKTPFFRASRPNSRGYKHGYQLWLRAATRKKDRTFTNMWDRWENDLEYRKSQKNHWLER